MQHPAVALPSLLVALTLAVASPARADGRYCEREDAVCWRCADIVVPAEIPCSDASACAAGELCVEQSGSPACFAPTTYCCATTPCEIPPGCPGAASSCGDTDGDGRNDQCTFLNDCGDAGTMPADAGPADGGSLDAGAGDAGPSDDGGSEGDAGAAEEDAGAVEEDAGSSSDAGTRDAGRRDAGEPPSDGGPVPMDGSTVVPPPRDDGGCGCSTPGATPAGALPLALFFLVSAVARVGRRR
jgi:hypothetical protein